MKVYNDDVVIEMGTGAKSVLETIRKCRQFDVETYVKAKTEILSQYFNCCGLTTAVIAISGGIDSAVVYALVKTAEKNHKVITNVVPVCIPAYDNSGVTHQSDAQARAVELCKAFGQDLNTIIIDKAVNEIDDAVRKEITLNKTDWSIGQLVPYTRTPTLYYITSLYTDAKKPAVIVGTTNRDEGAYLGYVGKASDGMVDLQLISDLHKSEVYQVAKYLGIPESIINVTPNGDMFDGRDDIELFGASYDYVELMIGRGDLPTGVEREAFKTIYNCKESVNNYIEATCNLERLHGYNSHKYNVGSPAVHLDIMPSGTSHGWKLDFENKYQHDMLKGGNIIKPQFVSPVSFDNLPAYEYTQAYYDYTQQKGNKAEYMKDRSTSTRNGNIVKIENIISEEELSMLAGIFNTSEKKTANVHGRLNAMDTLNSGSKRVSWYSVEFADILWARIRNHIDVMFQDNGEGYTQYGMGGWNRAVGINPLMRFIGYTDTGMLVPHYDYEYTTGDYRSMMTVVIYLTTNETGATRFIKDERGPKAGIEDWQYIDAVKFNETCTDEDFILKNQPVSMTAVVFPHYTLHDCEEVVGEHKLIIRTDIMCESLMGLK